MQHQFGVEWDLEQSWFMKRISGIVFPKSGNYWLQIKNWRVLSKAHIWDFVCSCGIFDVLKKTNTLLSLLDNNIAIILKLFRWLSLLKKCPNTELFSICIFPYSVQIRENKDENKFRIWTLFKQWSLIAISQPAITCAKLAIETLEEGVKYVRS